MSNRKATKRALLTSVMALVMCVVMLVGTTFAWFTDTASTGVNKIQAGNLDVALEMNTGTKENPNWVSAEGKTLQFKKAAGAESEQVLWEPGCRYELPELRVVNNGNLALKYMIKVTGIKGDAKLNDVIDWNIEYGTTEVKDGTGDGAVVTGYSLNPGASDVVKIMGVMDENAGNDYQGLSIDGISITVYATQMTAEFDSIDNQYDKNAQYPTDADALQNALTVGGNIVLAGDADPAAAIVANKTATINANGKTIANTDDIWDTSAAEWSLISAQGNDANLTITGNGTFKAKENDCYAVDVQDGATVTIENGTFIGNIHAVYVLEGTAYINGGFYSVQQKYPDASKANEFVLNCYDANREAGTAKIIVTGGTFVNFNPADCQAEGAHTNFVADGYGVVATPQANGDVWYTVVEKVAAGKTFTGKATLSTGITATKPNAIAVKATGANANVTILDGTFDGGNGGNNQCVHVEKGATVTIKGGTFTVGADANGYGNSVVESNGGNIVIEGGFFYTDYQYGGKYYVLNQQNSNPGTITVKGGTFVNYDPSKGDDYLGGNFVADGYKVVSETKTNGDIWYTVVAE